MELLKVAGRAASSLVFAEDKVFVQGQKRLDLFLGLGYVVALNTCQGLLFNCQRLLD